MVTIATVLLCVALVLLVIAVLFAFAKTEETQRETREAYATSHDECIQAVTWHVKHEMMALTLEQAARDLDSVEAKSDLAQLRFRYVEGGPSVPALWLRSRAATLREEIQP